MKTPLAVALALDPLVHVECPGGTSTLHAEHGQSAETAALATAATLLVTPR